MDALIKSVIQKYSIPDSAVEEYSNGAVSISLGSLQEADEIYRVFLRKKRLHVELHIYSWAVTENCKGQTPMWSIYSQLKGRHVCLVL